MRSQIILKDKVIDNLDANQTGRIAIALAIGDKKMLKEISDEYGITPENFIGKDENVCEIDKTPNAIVFNSYVEGNDKYFIYTLSPSNLVRLLTRNLTCGGFCELEKNHCNMDDGLEFHIHEDFYDEYGNALQPSTKQFFVSPVDNSLSPEQKFRQQFMSNLYGVSEEIESNCERDLFKGKTIHPLPIVKELEIKFQKTIDDTYHNGKCWWDNLKQDYKHQHYEIFKELLNEYQESKGDLYYFFNRIDKRIIPELALRQGKFYKRNIKVKDLDDGITK